MRPLVRNCFFRVRQLNTANAQFSSLLNKGKSGQLFQDLFSSRLITLRMKLCEDNRTYAVPNLEDKQLFYIAEDRKVPIVFAGVR